MGLSRSFSKAAAVPRSERPARGAIRRLACAALVAACAGRAPTPVCAATNDPAAAVSPGATAISTSHRFLVSGMSSAENAALAAAAEDVAERIEALVGRRLPFQRGETLQLSIRFAEQAPRPQVVKAQGWVDRQLAQKLVVVNPGSADQEDVLEGLCWLMLNRYVVARQDVEARSKRLGTVPDWLAAGVAQSLFISLRARNSHVVLKRWQRGEAMELEDLLALEYLPDGRWAEKAFCGAAVDWLAELPRANELFAAMLDRRARRELITADWLGQRITGSAQAREAEKAWSLWIAQQSNVKRHLGGATEEDLYALGSLMKVRPEEFGITAATNAPQEMDFEELLDHRREPWMGSLAAVLSLKVKGLGIAASPEFREVVTAYGRFLDGLAKHAAAGWFSRFVRNVPSRRGLERMLAAADESRDGYRRSLRARERYVSGVERGVQAGWAATDTNAVARMDRSIPRTELQRYVDEIEKLAP